MYTSGPKGTSRISGERIRRPPAAKYEDKFKGVARIGNYIVIPATRLPEAVMPGLKGMPGLAPEVLYSSQKDQLTDFEVVGELQGRKYRLMLPEALEQLVGELEAKNEVELRIQFNRENEVFFSFPDSPGFVVGKAGVAGGTIPKAGEIIKCKLKPREWKGNEVFQEIFFGRLVFEDITPTIKGKLPWELDEGRTCTYMIDALPHEPNESVKTVAQVPTVLLFGTNPQQVVDLVMVDDKYNAYPIDKKALAEILLQMINEGGEIEAVPAKEAGALLFRESNRLGDASCFADIYYKGEKQLTWLLVQPHYNWFSWLEKGTRVKVQLDYRGQKGLPLNQFIAELSQKLFCFVLLEPAEEEE